MDALKNCEAVTTRDASILSTLEIPVTEESTASCSESLSQITDVGSSG